MNAQEIVKDIFRLVNEDQLMSKGSMDKHPLMNKALTDKTCRWICLTSNYPLISTGQQKDKMTKIKGVEWSRYCSRGQSLLTLVVSLKIEAYLI